MISIRTRSCLIKTMTSQQNLPLPLLAGKEIGSDFEIVERKYLISDKPQKIPWEDSSEIIYVESGRQALASVESELRGRGENNLHVASYLCDSMISPFQNNGWTLSGLPVDSNLVVNPTDLLSLVFEGVLLHTPYFGRQDSPATLESLRTLRRRGVVVVVDETHRIFSGPSSVADMRIASLRKLLPLFDGGYATGLSAKPRPRLRTPQSESAVLRRRAMLTKSTALAVGDRDKAHLELFAKAEHATQIRTQPAPMSGMSVSLLQSLNIESIRATREINSIALTRALGQSDRFRVINPPAADLLPSHLVLESDDVPGLQQYLVRHRIYCPVHWPHSKLLPPTQAWPDHYISLPIDHRYDETAMLRMAACIQAFYGVR